MIGRDAEMGRALLEHLQDRLQHADHGAVRRILALREPAQAVEVAEQLVGAVDEVNDDDGSNARGHDGVAVEHQDPEVASV